MTRPPIEIWHNPTCSKSRRALALLEERGVEVRVVHYLETPPTPERLAEVFGMLGVSPGEILRDGEDAVSELGLSSESDPDQILSAMTARPILIQRPIVIAGNRAVVGRPPERVLELV